MQRPESHRRSILSAASGLMACLVAAAPRPAGAAIVTLSESYQLTARATVGETTVEDLEPGSTASPVSPIAAQAQAVTPGASATTALNLTFNGLSIGGNLTGASTATAVDGITPHSVDSDGTFNLTFSVTEATPYVLTGRAAVSARFFDDVGRAEVTLTENGTTIAGAAIGPGGNPTGGASFLNSTGTLLPGRTYALLGSIETPIRRTSGSTLMEFSDSTVEFALAVPEPAALGLLGPAAALLLARRGSRHGRRN